MFLNFLIFLIYSEKEFISLNPETFESNISNNKCFLVRYFSYHQEPSIRSHKDYNLVGKSFSESDEIMISGLDCGKYRFECLKHKVYDLPSIRLYCSGKMNEYSGGFSYESINSWVNSLTGIEFKKQRQLIHSPNGKTFKNLIDDNACVLGFFHTPWCTACKRFMPRLIRVSRQFINYSTISFAEVDVDRYRSFLRDYDLHVFPEIRLFVRGEKNPIEYGAKRSPKMIIDFINHYCGTRVELNDIENEIGLNDEGNSLTEEFFNEKRNPFIIQKMRSVPGLNFYCDLLEGLIQNDDNWLDEQKLKFKTLIGESELSIKEKDEINKKINIISYIKEIMKF